MLGPEIGINSLVTDSRPHESRRQLDGLVVNIELTLTSIIQGVALYFLTDNARAPLSQLRFEYWIYVANGLILVLVEIGSTHVDRYPVANSVQPQFSLYRVHPG